MSLSIATVIPALNEEASVAKAVRSAWEAGVDEVVVVDGQSSDQTAQIAQQAGARVMSCPPSRASQQNMGAAQTRSDVLLFLHADCRLDATAGDQVRAALEAPEALAGAFRQRIEASGRLYRLLELGNAWRAEAFGVPYGDQGLFWRRSVFEQLGGFPDVPLMEDLLLMRATRRLARPVLVDGPLYVSARRWQQRGVVRQTLRNWSLLVAHACGVSPQRLASYYR